MTLINKIYLLTSIPVLFLSSSSCVVIQKNANEPNSPPAIDVKEEDLSQVNGFDGYFNYFLTTNKIDSNFNQNFRDFTNRFNVFKQHPFWTRKGYTKEDFYNKTQNKTPNGEEIEEEFEKESPESEIDSPARLMNDAMNFEFNKINYYFYKAVSFEDYSALINFRSYVIIKQQLEFLNAYVKYQRDKSAVNYLNLYDKYLDFININNLKLVYDDEFKKNLNVFFDGDINNFNHQKALALASNVMTKIIQDNNDIFLEKEQYEPNKDLITLINNKIQSSLNIKEYKYLKNVVEPTTYTNLIQFFKEKEQNDKEKPN
ncbi:hypothetical protein GE118_00475 [Mycoplasma sp. NEAQ87857]|uniref:hypothetical protein n=1 Tax=Mycoplasma sp. NEAQ87857 TaxID=2683967 RepID=UPI001315CFED|nr:hypothetical protein [Mycoplasma sp. NEAQ87857]QGZ97279.1 hypothetical protein GE118_00475 [Mycoplasma sp. NEAQ87857]